MAVPRRRSGADSAGLPDDALDLALGDERVEQGLDHLLVGVGKVLDGLELAEQLAVGDAGGGGLVAGPADRMMIPLDDEIGYVRDLLRVRCDGRDDGGARKRVGCSGGTLLASYAFDALGNCTSISRGNGVTTCSATTASRG